MAAKKKEAPPEEDDAKDAKPDGEGGEGAEGVDLPKKKISGKKLAIFAVLGLLLLLIGGGAGLYFTGIIGGHETPAEGEEHAEGEGEGEHGAAAGPIFVDIPQILINLSSSGRRPTYLRLKINLELKKEEDRVKVIEAMPRVVDTFQMYLRELSLEELQGTAGIERLREELRLRVSAAVAPIEIKDVLFSDMIIQ